MSFLGAGSNPASFFQGSLVPGQNMFYNALKYNMGQEFGPEGQWAGNLARSQGMDQGAGQYYQDHPLLDPGSGAAQASAQGAFGNLLMSKAAADNAAAIANAQTKATAGAGILNDAQAYGSDLSANLQADQAMKNAEAAGGSSIMGDVMNGIKTVGGLASEVVAPGNPIGIQMAASGIGGLVGQNASPQAGSAISGLGSLAGGAAGGVGGMAGGMGSGFAMPGMSGTPSAGAMSGSLPSFIDPNQISGVSVDQGISPESMQPGMFGNWLSNVGAWF